MNTTTQITEADAVAFFQSKQAELRKQTGVKYSSIRLETDGLTGLPRWHAYTDGGDITTADTADEAIAAQVALLAPANRAARAKDLRDRAAALLAKAAVVEAAE
jgi:hypothetical protein